MDQPADRSPAHTADEQIDRLILQLRAYVRRVPTPKQVAAKAKREAEGRQATGSLPRRIPRPQPQPWVLIFDCETTTAPDQRLRFGAYQLRYNGSLAESGIFYDPDALSAADMSVLAQVREEEYQSSENGRLFLRTRADFVENVFYKRGHAVGAQIVGFNLPFDLSRLATGHTDALRGMKGGFSLNLAHGFPNVAVRHLSQKSAFIQFVGTDGKTEDDDENEESILDRRRNPDRGYFVDIKTLAATLTSQSFSLATLSAALEVDHPKKERDDHGAPITPDYVRYGLGDVQTTWECFEVLSQRLADLDLPDTGAYELFSEASLGKAYLRAMNVEPWRSVQPDFPPHMIGQILSGYFGGRAEVHIRRQATEVLHCDFLSMYPTVCTLMRLWNFVRAKGMDGEDDTDVVRGFVERCTPDMLQTPKLWPSLTVMVQVMPDRELFPVRAHYREGEAATIGLNYLTADEPLWFTLADVLAAKMLTGKAPKIIQAIRYSPQEKQGRLQPVTIAGATVDPASQDFYRSLIDHRQTLQSKEKEFGGKPEEDGFKRAQLAIKTLANATSYGIFVELNVEDYSDHQNMNGHGPRDGQFGFRGKKHEKPGQYFHPLLGALITGAARLMLALAESQVAKQGLDWVFCDTDSMAIANTAGLKSKEFRARAIAVTDWFHDLNPYAVKASILQVEKVNYGPKGEEKAKIFQPLYCFAVSAKRYVLFNRGPGGDITIRKASGHGLGHLLAPYDEEPDKRRARIKAVNVPLWQEDLWREIIRAGDSDTPDEVNLDGFDGYDAPAASQYAATSPRLLKWFAAYNKDKPDYRDQVKPFNFLLSLQVATDIQLAASDMGALLDRQGEAHIPRAAAPYFREPAKAAAHAFDRQTGAPIAPAMLKEHGRSLVLYHLHPEGKFHGGDYDERGVMRRRHVHALTFQAIGKEADNIEAQEYVQDEEGPIEHPLVDADRQRLLTFIEGVKAELGFSDREITLAASATRRTLIKLREGEAVKLAAVRKLAVAVEQMRKNHAVDRAADQALLVRAKQLANQLGSEAALARKMGKTRQWVSRVLKGDRPVTGEFRARLSELAEYRAMLEPI